MKKYLSIFTIFIITTILCMAGFVFGQTIPTQWNSGNTVTVNAEGEPWAEVTLSDTAVTLTYKATLQGDSLEITVVGQDFTLTIDTNVNYEITANFEPDGTNFSGKTVKLMFGAVDLLTSPNSIKGAPTNGEPAVHTLTVEPDSVSDLKYFTKEAKKIGTITFTVAEQISP